MTSVLKKLSLTNNGVTLVALIGLIMCLLSNSVHAEYQYNSTRIRVTEGTQAVSNDMSISCSGSGEVMTSIRAYGKMLFYNGYLRLNYIGLTLFGGGE